MQPSGEVIRHYRLLGKLGAGGMGIVHHALDTRLNRHVALKLLPDEAAMDETARAAILSEARAASALDHPNIGVIHGIEETEDGRPFIVMAYYEGLSLAQKLRGGPLTHEETIGIAIQIARGLAEAHAHNIVHRDIKPSNIMLTTQGAVKIVDFGIARVIESTKATQSMAIAGTAAYMSPEQAQGKRVDWRSDLWSFGMVLYEMAAGRVAFEGPSLPAMLYAIVHSPPAELPATVPQPLQQAIYRALAKDPEQRYQHASEMLADLQPLAAGGARPDDPTLTERRLRQSRHLAGVTPAVRGSWSRRWWILGLTPILMALAFLALAPAARQRITSWLSGTSAPHIAVLPLEMVGGGAEQALADGIMESLTSRLSNLQVGQQSLWVVPASEVRRRKVTDPGGALKTFGANLVVSGTLQREGNLIRLIVNLIDARNTRQIGSGQLEDRAGDYAGLQDAAVAKLANLMNIPVSAEMLKNTGGSLVPAAYQAYLQALGYIQRFDRPGNLDQAIALLESALKADPKFALGYAAMGEAYLTRFRVSQDKLWLDKAGANCSYALQLNENLAPVHVTMGRIHNGAGNEALALQEFQRAQKLEPFNADALAGMAQVYEKQKRVKDAEQMFQQAAVLRPDFWDGYSKLGNFYLRQKRYGDAETQFRKVIALTPDNYVGYQNAAAALIEAGRLPEAAAMLEKAAGLAPSYGIYANLGQVYFRQKKYAEAAARTEQALRINDKDFRLWTNLAGMYRLLGRDAETVALYRKVLPLVEQAAKASPQEGELQGQLAEVYAYTGQKAEASARIETALALAPANPAVLARCADASDAIGQRDRAVSLVQQALKKGYAMEDLRSDPEARGILSDPRLQIVTPN